ncbi:MAG: small-conductance mechanosensitive channel [Methanobacteriota archaeon]|jgi:small-conductance mechanosensitive channel|uniref:Mechanosensitive ion channel n=1 Tax=Halorutilus salinus TaxID=2487751 RepID=A0A9Q4GJ45_9EURY|nr:mechanosensitive ion channel domain-containing protein [Halorutilus salinus]MCX2818871.1 mechanosensitive ion channel [Halorutilus salinus]
MVTGVPEPVEVEPIGVDLSTVVAAVFVLAVAVLAARVLTYVLTRLSERSVERRITFKMFVPITRFVVYAAAVYYVLVPLLELSPDQILAFSAVFGAVLALGVQDLFANIVGGIVITFERPYTVGDKVEFGDHYGEVTNIGIRSTKLLTPDDSVVTVPNYLFFTNSLSNANAGAPEMMVVVEFYVSPDADTDRATGIIRDALKSSRYVYLSEDHGVVSRLEDAGGYTAVRGKAYVNDVRNEKAFKTRVSERVLRSFDDEDVRRADPAVVAVREHPNSRQEY